jgi:hypothetical protein
MQLHGETEENNEISKSEQPSVPGIRKRLAYENGRCCLRGPCQGVMGNQVISVRESEESVGREPSLREDLSAEAEESQLLEAVTRERLVNTAGLKRLSRYCGDL